MSRIIRGVWTVLALFVIHPANGQLLTQKLPEAGHIALDGNVLLIAGEEGPVVYEYSTSAWQRTADLTPQLDPTWMQERGAYPARVAASSGRLAVLFTGVAYVFEQRQGIWTRSEKLTLDPSEYAAGRSDFSPADIAMQDSTLAFTTVFREQTGALQALVYVWTWDGATWVNTARIQDAADQLRGDLALHHDMLVAGSYLGAAIYTQTGSSWDLTQYVDLTDYRYGFSGFPDIVLTDTLLIIDSANVFERGTDHLWARATAPATAWREEYDLALYGDRMFVSTYNFIETYVAGDNGWRLEYRDAMPARGRIEANDAFLIMSWPIQDTGATTWVYNRAIYGHAPQPLTPADKATNLDPSGLSLVWRSTPDALSYDVSIRRLSDSEENALYQITTVDTTITVSLPEYGDELAWRVRARYAAGDGLWSVHRVFDTMDRPANLGEWDHRFAESGPNAVVRALAAKQNQQLFVGGEFVKSALLPASYLAQWNGMQWSGLGAGVNGPVTHLILYDHDQLVVAGSFTEAGGQPAPGLARWNATERTWIPESIPVEGRVRDMAFDYRDNNPSLYIAVETDARGGRVYRWRLKADRLTGTLSRLGGDFPQPVAAIAADATRLVIGLEHPVEGYGAPADCALFGCMAEFIDAQWVPLDATAPIDCVASIDHIVLAFGEVHAAGEVAWTIEGKNVPYLARYDGVSWSAHGEGLNAPVTSLSTSCGAPCTVGFRGDLDLLVVGADLPGHVRLWNGGDWYMPDQGVDGAVYAFAGGAQTGFEGAYFGGAFNQAGGFPSTNLARWRLALPISTEPEKPLPASGATLAVFPNPARGNATLIVDVPLPQTGDMAVYDMLGRLVHTQRDLSLAAGQNRLELDMNDLPAGLYLIRLQTGATRVTARLIKAG